MSAFGLDMPDFSNAGLLTSSAVGDYTKSAFAQLRSQFASAFGLRAQLPAPDNSVVGVTMLLGPAPGSDTALFSASREELFFFWGQEVPQTLPESIDQVLSVHKLVGGYQTIDTFGAHPAPITFEGIIWTITVLDPPLAQSEIGFDANAITRSDRLAQMAKKGGVHALVIGERHYPKVVIRNYTANIKNAHQVHYSMTIEILEAPNGGFAFNNQFGALAQLTTTQKISALLSQATTFSSQVVSLLPNAVSVLSGTANVVRGLYGNGSYSQDTILLHSLPVVGPMLNTYDTIQRLIPNVQNLAASFGFTFNGRAFDFSAYQSEIAQRKAAATPPTTIVTPQAPIDTNTITDPVPAESLSHDAVFLQAAIQAFQQNDLPQFLIDMAQAVPLETLDLSVITSWLLPDIQKCIDEVTLIVDYLANLDISDTKLLDPTLVQGINTYYVPFLALLKQIKVLLNELVVPGTNSTVVVENPNLYDLAARVYGDPMQWTVIANANNLSAPILTGTYTLVLPSQPNVGVTGSTDGGGRLGPAGGQA